MSKKWVLILVSLLLIAVTSGIGIVLALKKSKQDSGVQKSKSLINPDTETTSNQELEDLLYEDESGFSFTYSGDLEVSKQDFDENTVYSDLFLTKSNEKIHLLVKDTSYSKIEDWLSKDPLAPKNTQVSGAITLSGVPAKQYSTASKLYTIAIDQGVLYFIESPKGDSFWEQAQDKIVDSFKFESESSTTTTGSGSSDTVYEEEEVVE